MSNTSMNEAIGFSMVFLACLPLSAGCSSERSASRFLEPTTVAQADALVHGSQTELAAIRRDLAATRIATSKQEEEAAELSRKAKVLEADRAELRQMLEQAHSAVNMLQSEQDERKQTLVQPQAVSLVLQNSGAPTKLDETDLQADMKELNARMVILTDKLAQMKQRFSNNVRATAARSSHESSKHAAEAAPRPVAQDKTTQPRIVPSAVFLASAEPAPPPGHTSDLSPQQRLIQVQAGDSLWKLAHEHAQPANELNRVNGQTTDVGQGGRRLILPSPMDANVLT